MLDTKMDTELSQALLPAEAKAAPVDYATEVLLSCLTTRVLKKRLSVLKSGGVLREAEGGYEVSGYWVDKTFTLEIKKL